jgi:glycosyltransferase involved in cell wall biosynthesis
MLSCTGIGTFLKHVIPAFSPQTTTLLLYEKDLPLFSSYPHRLCTSKIYSLYEQIELPRLIPPCDLFWSPHYNVPLLPIRARRRAVTLHDTAPLSLPFPLYKKLYAHLFFRAALSSDLVFTVSSFSKTEIARHFHKSSISIPLGVDPHPTVAPLETVRAKYNLPPAFFFCIGNLKPHKNLQLIYDAYAQQSLPIPTVVAGKGEKGPPPLHYIGEVLDAEVPALYHMATALLFPSLYEGFGLPPLEAMASGCPVIASHVASIPEVCGNAALLIDPHDPLSLAGAMLQLYSSAPLRERLIALGGERITHFSWETTRKQYRTHFASLV